MNKLQRGHAAQVLLDSDIFKEVLAETEQHYIQAWRQARTVEAREDCHRYLTLTAKITDHLKSIATTGALERRALDELEGRKGNIFAWPKI